MRAIGVVVIDDEGKVIHSHVIEPPTELMLVERANHLYRSIPLVLRSIDRNKVRGVFFEGLAFAAVGRIGDIGGFHHVARLSVYHWWDKSRPMIVDIPSSQVRSQVLGSNAPKGTKVKDWLAKRSNELGYPVFQTDHELDAYLTACAGLVQMGIRKSISQPKPSKKKAATLTGVAEQEQKPPKQRLSKRRQVENQTLPLLGFEVKEKRSTGHKPKTKDK